MEKAPVERITRQVIVPFAVTLLAVLAAGLFSMFYVERHSRQARVTSDLAEIRYFSEVVQAVEGHHLLNELSLLSRDAALRDAFVRQDRAALLRVATPLFEALKARSGATHFYFFMPDQRVFLRVHYPPLHGDLPPLATLRRASQTRQPAYGVEMGAFGLLALRVVQPWVVNGQLLGFLGLGKEVSGFASQLHQILGGQVFVALGKQHLERQRWEEGLRILGRQGNWNELPDVVVIDRTMAAVPSSVAGLLAGPVNSKARTAERQVAGRYYHIGLSPLVDAVGTPIGTVVVMFDVTGERQNLLAVMGGLALVALCLAVAGFLLFWGHIDRLDRRLVVLQERLKGQLVERGSQLRHSAELLQADIALREEVEREYAKICQRHRLILDAAGQGIFGLDVEGRHTFVNPAAAAMLGYTTEELVGQKSHALCHHSRADGSPYPEDECPIYLAFKDGESHHIEQDLFWRKDGSKLWVEYTSTPLHEDGLLTGAVVAFRDITVRKEALEALAESEAGYRAITDTAQDAILLMDAEGKVAFWNPAAEKIFGYRADEILGQELHEILAVPEFREPYRQGFAHFRSSGKGEAVGKTLTLQALRKNGEEFPIELSLSALPHHGGWWSVGVVRDISERVAAEKERENLQAQIRQAQKMEAIGTLAGGIAHDFNNILGAIIGYTELALLDGGQGRPVSGYLTEIRRASDRAKDLVAHILTFSRQGEVRQQPVNVVPVIKEALKLLRASLPAEIEIRSQIDQEVGKIMADPVQIQQCFMNLCANAAQSMREKGGVLEVGLTEEEFRAETVPPESRLAPGRYLRLIVADTGHGMSAEVSSRIFEPFFSTRERWESTGLGLAVVHGIVTSHGGGITVASQPGQGTTFNLYFPLLAPVAAKPAGAAVVAAPPVAGGGECVLLVDDEPQLVALGQRILEYLGYAVTTTTSSTEALALFTAEPAAFDLVITDQSMPAMTGVELARQLLAIRPGVPIILCTGFSETVGEQQAKALGIRGFVMKPLSVNDLAVACRNALGQRG